jgi:hypothetical protein
MIHLPYVGPMDEAIYHADKELPNAALSHSLAHLLVTRSPRHAWTACRKLNSAHVEKQSSAFDLGSAAHTMLLEGDAKVCVVHADDWRKKEAKEAKASARDAGLYPVLASKYDDLKRMVDIARETIATCADLSGINLGMGRAEQVAICEDFNDAYRIILRIRPDWWTRERDVIMDYKTTGTAHPLAWLRTMLATGADIQEAMYRDVNERTGGPSRGKFIFIVQETEPPFACQPIALSPGFRMFAEEKYERAKNLWRQCMKSGAWPSYPNRIAYLEPPSWALAAYQEGIPIDLPDEGPAYQHNRISEQA